ncbi:MAG: porin [Methylophilaceae bacterium]|nr:porin [Methylophilaceae bacterium]
MHYKNKILTSLLIASGIISTPLSAFANDSSELEQLRSLVQELDQKVRILERKGELGEEVAVAEKKAAPVIKADAGRFGLSSADGKNTFNLHALVQADYRAYDNSSTNATGSTDGWLIRKARTGIDGTLFGWVNYRITPEFAGSGPVLMDAYVDLNYKPWLKLRAGRYKPFVGLARLQGDSDGKFLEHSFVTGFVPQRDIGASIFGDLFGGKLSYALGYNNGTPDGSGTEYPSSEPGGNGKEVTGRLFAQPFKGEDHVLAGLGFGFAGTTITQAGSQTSTQLSAYKAFGQSNFFSYSAASAAGVTPATTATVADGERTRWTPQLYYYYGPFGLMTEYVHETQGVTRSTNHKVLSNDAWQATFSYVLTGEDASYGTVNPKQAFSPNSGGWGAWEVVARVNGVSFDDNAFIGTSATRLADISKSAKSATAYGAGINWYINNYTRFGFDYEHTEFEGGGVGSTANAVGITKLVNKKDENTVIGRLQVAF